MRSDPTFSLCVGIILGSALTVLAIVLQAMFAKPKPPRSHHELGSRHDSLDAEAAAFIARRRASSNRKPGRSS